MVRDIGLPNNLLILQVPGFIHFLHLDIPSNQSFVPSDTIISLLHPCLTKVPIIVIEKERRRRRIQDYFDPLYYWPSRSRRWYLHIPFPGPGSLKIFLINNLSSFPFSTWAVYSLIFSTTILNSWRQTINWPELTVKINTLIVQLCRSYQSLVAGLCSCSSSADKAKVNNF